MKGRSLLAWALICFLGLSSCNYQPPSIHIEQEGDELIIHSGKHTLRAREIGKKTNKKFLLVGGTGRGLYPFTAHFSAVSMSSLQRVEREYGGFLKSKQEGALESLDHVKSMFLYAVHESVAEKIHRADTLAMSWKYPIVSMTFVKLDILEHTVNVMGRPVEENPEDYGPCYLVVHLEIVQPNYP